MKICSQSWTSPAGESVTVTAERDGGLVDVSIEVGGIVVTRRPFAADINAIVEYVAACDHLRKNQYRPAA